MADTLLTTANAAKYFGVSVSQFTNLMKKLNIIHDDEYRNPHKKSAPGKLWSKLKLSNIKRRKTVKEYLLEAGNRSEKSKQVAQAKVDKLLEECAAWVPRIKKIKNVQECAISAYNDWNEYNGRYADKNSSLEFLNRITINFIRHQLTDYEAKLKKIEGKTGTNEAYAAQLRPIVDKAIEQAYPELFIKEQNKELIPA